MYTLEGRDGSLKMVDKSEVMLCPLRAEPGEPEWACKFCRARGWSHGRARCCVGCGQAAPMDEAAAEEMRRAARAKMVVQRPHALYTCAARAQDCNWSSTTPLKRKARAEHGVYDATADDGRSGERTTHQMSKRRTHAPTMTPLTPR